jgi:hypothetical protein
MILRGLMKNGGISLHLTWTSFRSGSDFVYQKRRIEFSKSLRS